MGSWVWCVTCSGPEQSRGSKLLQNSSRSVRDGTESSRIINLCQRHNEKVRVFYDTTCSAYLLFLRFCSPKFLSARKVRTRSKYSSQDIHIYENSHPNIGQVHGRISYMMDSQDVSEQELKVLRDDAVGKNLHISNWINNTLKSLHEIDKNGWTKELKIRLGTLWDLSTKEEVIYRILCYTIFLS
ncbi:uncharacterized protein [Temnothorax nylanderi]|uniref:uncharacterized protein isoform X1 n=1 Tax=Temnothorax nylanderi TaxID=102681 RepID=UPI003A842A7C